MINLRNPFVQAFPGHWAPRCAVYTDTRFPERYRGSSYIAWYGSWNRAPLPQRGYKAAYSPFDGARPADNYKVFAGDSAGADTLSGPGEAEYHPIGLAVGPEDSLYVSDDKQGRIWRIAYVGAND